MKNLILVLLSLCLTQGAFAQSACENGLLYIQTKESSDMVTLNKLRGNFQALKLRLPPIEDLRVTSTRAGHAMPVWTSSSILVRANYTERDLQCAKEINAVVADFVKSVTGKDMAPLTLKTDTQAALSGSYTLEWSSDLSAVIRILEAAQEESRIIHY